MRVKVEWQTPDGSPRRAVVPKDFCPRPKQWEWVLEIHKVTAEVCARHGVLVPMLFFLLRGVPKKERDYVGVGLYPSDVAAIRARVDCFLQQYEGVIVYPALNGLSEGLKEEIEAKRREVYARVNAGAECRVGLIQ